MSKRNPLLPSTSRPFLFPRRQWWTACFLQPVNALTTSVCKHVSSRAHHRSRCGCSAVVCGDRLHKCWSVPLFVSSLFFFPPMELLGPATTLRCYWPAETRSPAPCAARDRRWRPGPGVLQHQEHEDEGNNNNRGCCVLSVGRDGL